MKKVYLNNGYAFVLSNDYDRICKNIQEYMKGIRVPCKYCIKHFYNKDTLKTHYRVIHRFCLTNYCMDTDQIIKECLEKQERQKQLQIMQLRNNLKTFTHKELKKEADKFAVT